MSFSDLHISPKLAKNLSKINWQKPTEVQRTTIPLALAGRDLLVQSVTGSGKTGAFLIPIIDRLVLRGKYRSTSVLVLSPTRELAEQTVNVLTQLTAGLPISSALIVGGDKNFHSQQALLQTEPDVIVCTPGRLVDHIVNSPFILGNVEVLVIDEADKLLELGFQRELEMVVKQLSIKRQTMLFSATLTEQLEDLVALSLQKPLRVTINAKEVSQNIQQQFVIIGKTFVERVAALRHIVDQYSGAKQLVFAENRHQVDQICNYLEADGLDFYKITSDLSQNQRHRAIDSFREDPAGLLISTDLSARGLDIDDVELVILFNCPVNADEYIHRVGRTGRFDKTGVSICFGEKAEIKQLVEAMKEKKVLKERLLDAAELRQQLAKFDSKEFRALVRDVVQQHKEEEGERKTEENLKRFDGGFQKDEKRAWFLQPKERKAVAEVVKQTSQGIMNRDKARTLLKAKNVRAELLKLKQQKTQKGQKRTDAHGAIRKNKAQLKKMKSVDGEGVVRNTKLDARKVK